MFANPTNTIISRRNQRIVEARKLQQRKHRQRQGRFLVEGVQLLEVALDAGLQPVEVFLCERQYDDAGLQALLDRFREAHADLMPTLPHIMETLSDRHNPESIIATFTIFETPLQAVDLSKRELVLIVDRPQSPANLGMIFRTADAVNAAAVMLIQPCVDPFHPMAIRVSLGTLFNVPFVQTSDIAGLFTRVCQEGFKPVGTDPYNGLWDQEIWKGKVALILGSDVHGMSSDVRPWVKDWARLPMAGKVESLSSAVAGSVLMYDWFRTNCKDR
ncbi:TrmH family RNA methyltransferase [Candidatus Poribacteria bacterium]